MSHKITSFIGILFLFNIFCAVAQKSDSSRRDTLSVWKLKSLYSLSGTQSSFVNWNAGGRNNISLIGNIIASADYNKAKWNWSSDATLAFGGIKYLDDVQGVDLQKTEDALEDAFEKQPIKVVYDRIPTKKMRILRNWLSDKQQGHEVSVDGHILSREDFKGQSYSSA